MRKDKRKYVAGLTLAMVLAGSTMTSFAGAWIPSEDGSWQYEEAGSYVTGWQQIDGFWYYLDQETGIWKSRPALNEEAAEHLVWNLLKRENLYQNEDSEVFIKVDYTEGNYMYVSAFTKNGPNGFSTLNTFQIDRSQGTAKSNYLKQTYDLFE